MKGSSVIFPSHNIPRHKKNEGWVLQFMRAAYDSFNNAGYGVFYGKAWRYEEIRKYMQGRQSVSKYKTLMDVDDKDDSTWLNVDWSIVPVGPKFRRVAIQRLKKLRHKPNAMPIDALAKTMAQEYFDRQKAKIEVAKMATDIAPELLQQPSMQFAPDEPTTIDQLEISKNYTWKHNFAIELEQLLSVVMLANNTESIINQVKEDIHDFGCAGIRDYTDNAGVIRARRVDPRNVIVGYSKKRDFSDAPFVGELVEMTINEFKQLAGSKYTEKEYEELAVNFMGKFGNPKQRGVSNAFSQWYDDFRIRVLDLEILSTDYVTFEHRKDRRGNTVKRVVSSDYERKSGNEYHDYPVPTVYQGMWVVGTDMICRAGLKTNLKRKPSKFRSNPYSFHLYANDLHEMTATGIGEQIIPVLDQIQLAYLKLQQCMLSAVPPGYSVEVGALEGIPIGKGGEMASPTDVLDLFFKRGTLVWRKKNVVGRDNWQPVNFLKNGIGDEAQRWFNIIQSHISTLRDVIGLNEIVDGSTPDARTLTTTARLAADASNNALDHIIEGTRRIFESHCQSVVEAFQDAVQAGKGEDYVNALGSETLLFFKDIKEVSVHDFAVRIDDMPTDEQRLNLLTRLERFVDAGMVDPEDLIMVENTDNVKVAQQIFSYKLQRKLKQKQQEQMQLSQVNAQNQAQSAQAAEAARAQTEQLKGQIQASIEQLKGQLEMQLEQMRIEYKTWETMYKEGMNSDRTAAGIESNEYQSEMKANAQMGNSQPPMGGGQPPMGGGQPPMGGPQPPMGGPQPPMGGGQQMPPSPDMMGGGGPMPGDEGMPPQV